jgi:hypothetical protein
MSVRLCETSWRPSWVAPSCASSTGCSSKRAGCWQPDLDTYAKPPNRRSPRTQIKERKALSAVAAGSASLPQEDQMLLRSHSYSERLFGHAESRPPWLIRRIQVVAVSSLAVLVLMVPLGLGESHARASASGGIYALVLLLAIAMALLRALLRPEERTAWLILSGGMVIAVAGGLYSILASAEPSANPWLSHALLLATYPAGYIALMLLLRPRLRGRARDLWLDGLTGREASLGSAPVWSTIQHEQTGACADGRSP